MTRTILAAAALLALATGAAQAQQVELITGVGFGQSRVEAQSYAIQAWVVQSIQEYGFGNWNTAAKFGMDCNTLSSGGGAATTSIGVGGNPAGASWACTISGIPAGAGG